ncbi:MAG: AAA family ATPase [archaeon]|jgi:dephospho-CoA kinase
MNNKPIICLTGFSGAGKSTLSRLLRKRYNLSSFKIGRYLELIAKQKQIPFKEYIQTLQQKSNTSTMSEIYINLLKAQSKSNGVLIEGINSRAELNELKRLFPKNPIFLFSIEAPFNTRVKRVKTRGDLSQSEAEKYVQEREKNRAQLGLDRVSEFCDGVIINSFSNERELLQEFEKVFETHLKRRLLTQLKNKLKSKIKFHKRIR